MNEDVKRLRLDAIRRRIGAASTALFACVSLIHVSVGLIFLLKPAPAQGDSPMIVLANHIRIGGFPGVRRWGSNMLPR